MRPIKDYEDYLINEDGTIIYSTLTNKFIGIYYNVTKNKKRDYIKPWCILYKNKRRKTCFISNLIYSTYNGDLKTGYQVDHIDNNPMNNHYSNLQLLTPKENVNKIYIDNPDYVPFLHQRKKVRCIETNEIFLSLRECARKLNLSVGALHRSIKWCTNAYP